MGNIVAFPVGRVVGQARRLNALLSAAADPHAGGQTESGDQSVTAGPSSFSQAFLYAASASFGLCKDEPVPTSMLFPAILQKKPAVAAVVGTTICDIERQNDRAKVRNQNFARSLGLATAPLAPPLVARCDEESG